MIADKIYNTKSDPTNEGLFKLLEKHKEAAMNYRI